MIIIKKVVSKILVVALIVGALCGIGVIILDLWNELTINILASTGIIFSYSVPGLCCSKLYDKEKAKKFSTIGMIICLVSCLFMLLLVWDIIELSFKNDFLLKTISISIILSTSVGHLSLLLLNDPVEEGVVIINKLTIILSIILDIILISCVLFGFSISWQIVTILGILIALGTLIVPVLSKKTKYDAQNIVDNKYEQLEQLKKLLDSNAITEEEYNTEKNKILNN